MSRTVLFLVIAGLLVVGGIVVFFKVQENDPPPTKADFNKVAQGNNQFAFDLYRQLAKEAKPDENIFFSPFSISAALAMTYGGARGETAAEMAKVLHFDPDQDKFHATFGKLIHQLRNPGKDLKGEFSIANAIWVDQAVNVLDPFKKLMERNYEAGLRTIDFTQSEAARKVINEWVEAETRKKIKELLPENSITHQTIMVLVNAIYFQANWKTAFEKNKTRQEKFYRTPTDSITVPMMHLKTKLRYAKTDDVQIVELPYAGDKFSMIILLPSNHEKLKEVEEFLHKWEAWKKNLDFTEVDLAMPRVQLEQKYSLKNSLKEMGMPHPFSSSADFSGMSSRKAHIDQIYHKANIDVDETGTTAAAATAVVIKEKTEPIIPVVRMDHPFLFLLLNVEQDTILFAGRVMTPSK